MLRGVAKTQKTTALSANGITQGVATQLEFTVSYVDAQVGNTAVILPPGFSGAILWIVTTPGGQPILLFPRSGLSINGGAANASVTIATTARVTTAVCLDGSNWVAWPLA